MDVASQSLAFRRAVRFVALANLAYFGIEFAVATAIGSVSLFADSIDFLEDASVNGLIMLALGCSAVWLAERTREAIIDILRIRDRSLEAHGTDVPL